jgi:hypothetical protein
MKDLTEFDQEILDHPEILPFIKRIENMLPVKWPYEFSLLAQAFENKKVVTISDVISELQYRFALQISEEAHSNKIDKAMRKMATSLSKQDWAFGEYRDGQFTLSSYAEKIISNETIYNYIKDRIEYGLAEFRRIYRPNVFFESQKNVVLYQNYTRNDLIYLFESEAKEGSWREGVSRVGNHILLFINLNKGEKVADHLLYHDYFVDQQHFHWQSQNPTSHDSQRGQEYIHHKQKGVHIHLLVRKFENMHGATLPFTYLGEIDYVSSHGDKPMNITWKLHQPIPESMYTDFIR